MHSEDTVRFSIQNNYIPEKIFSKYVSYMEILPRPELAEDVKYFWVIDAKKPLPFLVNSSGVSKGYIDLILTFEGNFCQKGEQFLFGNKDMRFYIVGPLTQVQNIVSAGTVKAIGARIKPGKAFPFLQFPINEITDGIISVEDAWYDWDNSILDILYGAKTFLSKIKLMENWLLQQKKKVLPLHQSINYALDIIHRTKGLVTMDQLGDSLGISFRQLQRKFLETVGMPPKMLCKITKVRHAIDIFNHEDNVNFTNVAYNCGFYDQSHFIRDFKSLTGITPGEYCSGLPSKSSLITNMSDLYNTSQNKKCKFSF